MIRWIICFVMLVIGGVGIKYDQRSYGENLSAWITRLSVVLFFVGLAGTCANILFLLAGWNVGW